MTGLSQNERQEIIQAALKWQFGELLDWERPKLWHEFGPNDLVDVERFEYKLRETIDRVRSELDKLVDVLLQDIKDDLDDTTRIVNSNWTSIAATEIDRLHRTKFPPIAFGFGHPNFATDFVYWCSMPKLSLHEVTMLSVGADPDSIKEDDVTRLAQKHEKGVKLWSAHICLLKYKEFFSRHFCFTGWGYQPERVQVIKQWIDETSFDVHPLFYERLDARFPKVSPDQTHSRKHDLGNQERETLLKIVAAMACEQYGYDPKAERSEAPSRIKDDIEQIGQSMDSKTIRKWLKE